jgi:putative ABC transport system ATP-binding protein
MGVVETIDLVKWYQLGDQQVQVLHGVNAVIEEGEYVSIMGPSGSGKSTFLNLLGCLDQPTSGKYLLGGIDVSTLNDNQLSEIRRERIGFVFQSFNLLPELSVLENIQVPHFYKGTPQEESREISARLAESVGLGHRLHHRSNELSGGERQRVSIARSLANNPYIILADEPTGNLDSKSGAEILSIFDRLHEEGKTILMVTHDEGVGQRTGRTIRFKDGLIQSDTPNRPVEVR